MKTKKHTILKKSVLIIVTFLILLSLLGQTDLGNFSSQDNSEFNYVTIQKNTIRYLQKGQGKDILLIHGSPGSIEDWNKIIDSLSVDYRVTAFDRLGHGYSSDYEYSHHIEDNAILTNQIIKQFNLKSPLIVGHSYGGSTAAFMAVNDNNSDQKYIILDSPLYEIKMQPIYMTTTLPVLGKGFSLLFSYTISDMFIENGLNDILVSIDTNQRNTIIKQRQHIWSQPKVIFNKSMETKNYNSDLKQISNRYPNLKSHFTIVTTKDTLKTFRKDCEKFHKEIPNSSLIYLENTGHYIQIERPWAVLNIIRQKMEGQPSSYKKQ
ncbi:alpha/beta fold hydrolase [Tenacibaculum xiamenense]|uniref:alpha/beta fold hydrolase n=1 Tax=Tenacibaculum xiamenense TaxID=1261553 RepID=UPI003893B663